MVVLMREPVDKLLGKVHIALEAAGGREEVNRGCRCWRTRVSRHPRRPNTTVVAAAVAP
jgi:hypothetical protein